MIVMGMIVGLITVTASLFLAVRSFQSHQLSFETKAMMAAAWLLIFVVVGFIAVRLGL